MSVAALPGVVRVGIKLYVADPSALEPERLIGVFHDWIRRGAVPGLLIDVADYAHVHEGPGVMLIGHEADYALDLGEGRPGVLYQRKRHGEDEEGDLRDRLRGALRCAVLAARELEADPGAGGIRFRSDELLVRILDRLGAPNDEGTLEALRPDLFAVLAEAHPTSTPALERIGDPKEPFAVRVSLAEGSPLDELAERLSG